MIRVFLILVFLFYAKLSLAFAAFTVSDIRIEGLQRVAIGTVFNYFPINRGDVVDSETLSEATRSLYASGLFKDAIIERSGNVLVLRLLERPAINSLEFKGNKEIKTDDLKDAFKQLGISPGRVLNSSALDKAAQELERQYVANGRYGTKVKPKTVPLERNRVAVIVNVYEGATSRVKYIRLVGNRIYNDNTLIKQLKMKPRSWYQVLSKTDRFNNEQLQADIEALHNFYTDRGYIDFQLLSSQVSISPDKKDITITYNISEGKKFFIRNAVIGGNTNVSADFLRNSSILKSGEVYSRKKLVNAREAISKKLGEHGYAFAEIDIIPQKVSANQVDLVYQVSTGKRAYVNRIHIVGNTRTRDEVIRRELRQFEGARFSADELKRSTDRLRRLGFFAEVNVETTPVPGSDDKLDITYSIVEKSTGDIKIGLGYSQSNGVGFTFGISQDNFLGTGKKFALNVSADNADKLYSFNIFDPYFTRNGVSLGYGLFFRERDTKDLDVAAYAIDEYGADINFGIPINEYDRIGIGVRVSRANIVCGEEFLECNEYVNEFGNKVKTADSGGQEGEFDLADVYFNWSRDSRDRAIYPTSGSKQTFNLTFGLGDAKYNRAIFKNSNYFSLSDNIVFRLGMDLGYGYSRKGDDKRLPFLKRFYVGGPGSVRGFDDSTLSRATANDPDRFLGGSLKTVFNTEVRTPMPFLSDNKAVRMITFVDAGYAFDLKDDFKASDLRVSGGVGVQWLSPIGPLNFSYALPIRKKDGDKLKAFQFQLGVTF